MGIEESILPEKTFLRTVTGFSISIEKSVELRTLPPRFERCDTEEFQQIAFIGWQVFPIPSLAPLTMPGIYAEFFADDLDGFLLC